MMSEIDYEAERKAYVKKVIEDFINDEERVKELADKSFAIVDLVDSLHVVLDMGIDKELLKECIINTIEGHGETNEV